MLIKLSMTSSIKLFHVSLQSNDSSYLVLLCHPYFIVRMDLIIVLLYWLAEL